MLGYQTLEILPTQNLCRSLCRFWAWGVLAFDERVRLMERMGWIMFCAMWLILVNHSSMELISKPRL
ncbi:hypothetical protein B188_21710 [Candidatus Brocadiaceae bacterium B188]|nr:hypothetical protein [Candidatus Brocadia sapporoensis]QQR67152.1 MAG: hypothetical protein IPI25_02680 [Candidatus Brocadia sp.]RZV58449.1 MAG: hypothetical protein EX330_06815 [Candidatus Brocadia sp. BROELEC01]TWU54175.1 hypothetical protein B188_21710 [Candidatus Brocadiaceae bacterium B188]